MRRRLIVGAIRTGRYAAAARMVGHSDPFEQSALFRAVDFALTAGRWDDLSRLAPLARRARPYAARIWRAIDLWQTHPQQAMAAFDRLGTDHAEHGFDRMGARAWRMFLELRGTQARHHAPDAASPGTAVPALREPAIFQFWDDAPPPEVSAEMARWKAAGGEGYVAYTLETAAAYIREAAGAREEALFRAAPHPAIQSDYFRLCRMMAEGGLYADADGRARPALPDFLREAAGQTAIWFRTREPALSIANCMMAAPPGAPFIVRAFEEAGHRLADPAPRHVFEYAGPTLLTETALEMHAAGTLGPVLALTDDEVSQRAMIQIDAAYKQDDRNWRRWQERRA